MNTLPSVVIDEILGNLSTTDIEKLSEVNLEVCVSYVKRIISGVKLLDFWIQFKNAENAKKERHSIERFKQSCDCGVDFYFTYRLYCNSCSRTNWLCRQCFQLVRRCDNCTTYVCHLCCQSSACRCGEQCCKFCFKEHKCIKYSSPWRP